MMEPVASLPEAALRGAVLAVAAMVWIIALTRVVGLRSFSKMTTFDFVMTVAMGSLLAGASRSTDWGQLVQAMCAMAGLFAAQYGIARLRFVSERAEAAIQNTPVVLMRDGRIDEAALDFTRVERKDLIAKLRAANVRRMAEVGAVVLETTGDISVLHGGDVADEIMDGTRSVGPVAEQRA
ncbi:DUF421 domain-containing protein [Roseicyclus salinarum]|uniref:DUF421 domain-containing protein n=1 Tax=Roseicyclus salinarum TaxID=3036773 RepID=UPI003242EECA